MRREETHREIHRGEGHVRMEAEIRIMHPPAKAQQGLPEPPEARRDAWDRSSLRAFRGSLALLTP